MKTRIYHFNRIPFVLTVALFSCLWLVSNAHAATVSGTVRDSGGTAITVPQIAVAALQGDPCGEWALVEYAHTNIADGTYAITVPDGTYYLLSYNMNISNYVNEWHTGDALDPSSVVCSEAVEVDVTSGNAIDKDFKLELGGSVSGMVYQGDGSTPLPDSRVVAWLGDPCEDRQWIADAQTDGNGGYKIWGLPATVTCYLQTWNENEYADEWYKDTASTYYCYEAEEISVSQGVNTPGYDFQLEVGGNISGKVVDESNVVLENVRVTCRNEVNGEWRETTTVGGGSFDLIGLSLGPWQVIVTPEVNDPEKLAWFGRDYYLNEGEARDLGTIMLHQGALVYGKILQVGGSLLPPLNGPPQYWYGGRFEMGYGDTDAADGSFAFRLPVGSYTLNLNNDSDYVMVPADIEVTDVTQVIDLGTLTAYDDVTGDTISGTVADIANPPYGELEVVAFLNSQTFTPDNFGGVGDIGLGEPDAGTGVYSLFVPPTLARGGETVMVGLVLFSEGPDGEESVTVVDAVQNQGTPTTVPLTYTSGGFTVDGYVKDSSTGEGIFFASVLLYNSAEEFVGFAETDHTGKYTFYNVPAANYKVAVTHPDYDDTEWSDYFEVNASITVPDIFVDHVSGDVDGDGDVDLTDAILALQVMAGINPSATVYQEADVNSDGKIGIEEVIYVFQEVSGLRESADEVTEQWISIVDGGQGSGNWTLTKESDGAITADGNWDYSYLGQDVTCPFTDGPVTISGSSFSFTATGTATNPSAPAGSQTSNFVLSVSGTTNNGTGSGTYTITFSTYGWPPSYSGVWEATRTSGSGITP